jgi:biotin-(acetyl-CoA carboxylase) ligase
MDLGREAVLQIFAQASSYVCGRRVRVDLDGHMLDGVTDGLDEFGFLRIRKEDGTRTTVYAGSIRPLD